MLFPRVHRSRRSRAVFGLDWLLCCPLPGVTVFKAGTTLEKMGIVAQFSENPVGQHYRVPLV